MSASCAASVRCVGALRRVVRPVAARLQARQTECGVALQMFVAGLATDAELFAQLGHGKAPATGEYNESIDLFHRGYVGPRHRPMCNLSPRIKCHLSRRIEPPFGSAPKAIWWSGNAAGGTGVMDLFWTGAASARREAWRPLDVAYRSSLGAALGVFPRFEVFQGDGLLFAAGGLFRFHGKSVFLFLWL